MADLNEPKKETVRITLPPRTPHRPTVPVAKDTARIHLPTRSPGSTPPTAPPAPSTAPAGVRPPPPLIAPKPLPPTPGELSKRPSTPPMSRPPAPLPSGGVRPPSPPMGSKTSSPGPAGAEMKAPLPPPPSGSKTPPPPPSALKPASPAPPAPGQPLAARPIEDRSDSSAPRKETARIASTPEIPMKATVRLSAGAPSSSAPAGVIRTAPVQVANVPTAGLVESVPMPICWALLGISALTLLIQIWTYLA